MKTTNNQKQRNIMKLKSLSFVTLLATMLLGGVNSAWADDVVVPTPVYFDDFSFTTSSTDAVKTEIVGNGVFEDDTDARFGRVFHNDPGETPSKAIRTNYLRLPNNVLSYSGTTKEMTIGFWVNVKNAADYWFSPIFSAYAISPAENAAASRLGNEGNFPMFVLQSRGLMQLNNGGYDDFAAADNVKETNTESTVWLDDKAWHYYTMTMTTTSAKVYIDGEIFNEWNIEGTEGHYVEGFFTYGGNYKYICLGGNQAWNWGDPDPAYAFDDFAVYNVALTVDQINQIRANKLNREVTGTKIGAIDNSIDYLGTSSSQIMLKPGESYHYSFINYNKGYNNWNNWMLPVYDAADTRVITVRADNWEDLHHVGEDWGSNAGCTSNFIWDNFPGELNGATVDMTVTFTAEKVFQMTSTITTVSGLTWNYSYTNDYAESTISLTSNDYIKVALSVSRSWIDLLSEDYSVVAAAIGTTGWATFSSDYALDFSKATTGLTAYQVKGQTAGVLEVEEVTGTVAAGTGLLLKGDEGSYSIPVAASGTALGDNLLVAGTGETVSAEAGKTKYALSSADGKAVFKKIDGYSPTIAKGKAYLQFNKEVNAPTLSFDFNNPTGIDASLMNKTINHSVVYNLAGQRVAQPKKGLYIVNGKKIVK